jgi:outer membrane receptor for ferrienterochelin and colicin
MNKNLILAAVIATSSQLGWTQESPEAIVESSAKNETVIEEIVVKGVRKRLEQAGTLTDAIMKTEAISSVTIDNLNAVNLSEAIRLSPGVRVSNECSMCGVKRIMLNGMKGEQTTILVDNLPVHTMISGYYAVDAIPTTGIDRIEVARGAGASLTAPEAIGGTINVISIEPEKTGLDLDVTLDHDGLKMVGALGQYVSNSGATRMSLVGQYDKHHQVDEDGNLVNEEPKQENQNLVFRLSQDIGLHNNVTLRVGLVQSEVFGGPMLGGEFADGKARSAQDVIDKYDGEGAEGYQLFEGGDVREQFVGKAWETAEWIDTERDEVSATWLREFNEKWNMTLSTSYARHTQDSFYEGFDYYAEDTMQYYDARFNVAIADSHLLTFGTDRRDEEMRSFSEQGAENPAYTSDSFDYLVKALYVQDTWYINDSIEAMLVLRHDDVQADFVDPNKPGVEIDESILSPRFDVRWMHNDQWISRISAGRGWRAPLSFFETDHGILDGEQGFQIDIHDLERSKSVTYSISYDFDGLTATGAMAWTEVQNLATLRETANGVPLLTQLEDDASVFVADLSLGYQLTDNLTGNFALERYAYDDNFKSSYAIAPVEERVSASFDWMRGDWNAFVSAVWYSCRNLAEYGYDGYNVADENGAVPSSVKPLKATSFFVLDFKVGYQINESFNVYVGASNLLDYRQVIDEDTPLFFDPSGAFDVGYIYGPLRGREAYLGLKGTF